MLRFSMHSCASQKLSTLSVIFTWLSALIFNTLLVWEFKTVLVHSSDVVTLNQFNFQSRIITNRDSRASIVYGHFGTKKDQKFIDNELKELADEFDGAIIVGALNCETNEKFCAQHSIVSPSKLISYPILPQPSTSYNLENGFDKNAIKESLIAGIPDTEITGLTPDTFDKFLDSVSIPKVILFSNEATVPLYFKVIGLMYKNRLKLGFLHIDSLKNPLAKKYGVTKLPHLMVIEGTDAKTHFTGKNLTFKSVQEFANIFSETFGHENISNANKNKMSSKPWLHERIPELTLESHRDICFSKILICVVYLKSGDSLSDDESNMLTKLADKYESTPNRPSKIKLMWMNLDVEDDFKKYLNPSVLPSLICVNTKKARYLKIDKVADEVTIDNEIDKILGGSAKFMDIGNNDSTLPKFAVRKAKAESGNRKNEEL